MNPLTLLHLSLYVCLVLLCCGALGFYGYALYSTFNYWLQSESTPQRNFQPPVTIVKRLRQVGPHTQVGLVTLCQQHYPTYQILVLVDQDATAAAEAVRKLIQQFPERDIQLVVSSNPPENKPWGLALTQVTALARHSLWVLIDPEIHVGSDYLHRLVQPFRYPGVGVVTCASRWRSLHWRTALEAVGMVTALYPALLVARQRQGVHFILGGTIALRRALLEKPGGSEALAALRFRQISDLPLGRLPATHGYRVVLSSYVVEQVMDQSTANSMAELLQRHLRWTRDLHAAQPGLYWLQGLTYGTLTSSLLLLTTHGAQLAWLLLGLTWLLRFALGALISLVLHDRTTRRYAWLLPVWDLLSFGLWCCGWARSRRAALPAAPLSDPAPEPASQLPLGQPLGFLSHLKPIPQVRTTGHYPSASGTSPCPGEDGWGPTL